MRNYLFALSVLTLLLAGCSAKKDLMNGHYDTAIRKTVRKLQKNPGKAKHLDILTQAYNQAQQRDADRIAFLKKEGRPGIWDEVFRRYSQMKSRQDRVKALSFVPPNVDFKDYDQEIIAAKKKAAEYFYAHGKQLLETKDRYEARKAWSDFNKVKSYYPNFRDIDRLIKQAEHMGTSHVLFAVQNKSGIMIPKGFEQELLRISIEDLNSQWVRYYQNEGLDIAYDFTVQLNMKTIDVSPEKIKEVHRKETKEIRDGWKYVLDEKGNVKKDTAGNDIKVPKMKTISCTVIEAHMHKAAIIHGTIDYIDRSNNNLLKTDPVTAETVFEHMTAMAVGDTRALKPETRKILNLQPMPFPPDPDLILQTSDHLKAMAKDIMVRNKHVIR